MTKTFFLSFVKLLYAEGKRNSCLFPVYYTNGLKLVPEFFQGEGEGDQTGIRRSNASGKNKENKVSFLIHPEIVIQREDRIYNTLKVFFSQIRIVVNVTVIVLNRLQDQCAQRIRGLPGLPVFQPFIAFTVIKDAEQMGNRSQGTDHIAGTGESISFPAFADLIPVILRPADQYREKLIVVAGDLIAYFYSDTPADTPVIICKTRNVVAFILLDLFPVELVDTDGGEISGILVRDAGIAVGIEIPAVGIVRSVIVYRDILCIILCRRQRIGSGSRQEDEKEKQQGKKTFHGLSLHQCS